MALNKFLTTVAAAAAMVAAGAANASITVTLNPAGINETNAAFQTNGFASSLWSNLVIDANTGSNVAYTETGTIKISDFKLGTSAVASGVGETSANAGAAYGLFGNFTLTGTGDWAGSSFTGDPGASFSLDLYADNFDGGTSMDKFLGTASLNAAAPQVALAIAFGGVAAGSTGTAQTMLTATLDFAPAAGTTGVGNFFEAPNPFAIQLSIGSAGGNPGNTAYAVSNTGQVTFTTPTGNNIPGTANVSFEGQQVPEPGVLALVSLGLIGAGLARRNKTRA